MNLRCIKAPNELIPFTDPRIRYPMLGSIKYDGHRMVALQGQRLITPSGKDHVNRHLLSHYGDFMLWLEKNHLVADGELWSPNRPFHELQSLLRTHDAVLPPDIGYYVFDLLSWDEWEDIGQVRAYAERYTTLCFSPPFDRVFVVQQILLTNADRASDYYEQKLAVGHEGIMLRSPKGTYKHGRCTILESHLLKFKNFVTEDAIIIGVEQMRTLKSDVVREVEPTGLLKRTYRDEDYEPAEAVGSFLCSNDKGTFKVKPGKGHTVADRYTWWQDKEKLIGTGIEFSHMPHGSKDAPRIGTLVRFRPDLTSESSPSSPSS